MKALKILPEKPTLYQIFNYLINPKPATVPVEAEQRLSPVEIRRLVRERWRRRQYHDNQ